MWLALACFLALALVAPLFWVSLAYPAEDGMIVIGRAATLLVCHGTPYLPAQAVESWFSCTPYLPAMAVFGLPGDAAVWLAIMTVVVLAAAFRIATRGRPRGGWPSAWP